MAKEKGAVNIEDLVQFVTDEADEASDPLLGKLAYNKKPQINDHY